MEMDIHPVDLALTSQVKAPMITIGEQETLGRLARLMVRRHTRLPMVYQAERSECSLACLAMISAHFGNPVSITSLRERFQVSVRGITLRQVLEIAFGIGLLGRPIICDLPQLLNISCPVMLHWDLNHFVVLKKVRKQEFYIYDPAVGPRVVSEAQLSRHFTGVAIVFSIRESITTLEPAKKLSLIELLGASKADIAGLVNVIILAVGVELSLLVQPLTLRHLVNSVLSERDARTAVYLGGVLVFTAVLAAALSYIRELNTSSSTSRLMYSMMDRVVRHGLSLPLEYFERRFPGQILSRYRSIEQIERFIATDAPSILLDALFSVIAIVLICMLSPVVGFASAVSSAIYGVYRAWEWPQARAAEEAMISARAREAGFLSDTLENVLNIKTRGGEISRHAAWLNRLTTVINARHDVLLARGRARSVKGLIFGIDLAVFAGLIFSDSANNPLRLGTLFAVLFLKSQLVTRNGNLVDKLSEYKMQDVYLKRLEDIIRSTPEALASPAQLTCSHLPGAKLSIVFTSVSFRYSEKEPLILDKLSFELLPGERLGLTGPSGCGKTTSWVIRRILGTRSDPR